MATSTEIAELRKMVNEPSTLTYTDDDLSAIIDDSANLNAAASTVWTQKAARYAELVNVKEGNSSRDLGSLYNQALAMSKSFNDAANATPSGSRPSRTRLIERP